MRYRVRIWFYRLFVCWWRGHVSGESVGRWDDRKRCIHCRRWPERVVRTRVRLR